MATQRFYPVQSWGSTFPVYPVGYAPYQVLSSNDNEGSYLYVTNGRSDYPVSGECYIAFDTTAISNFLNGKPIKSCTFGMVGRTSNHPSYYNNQVSMYFPSTNTIVGSMYFSSSSYYEWQADEVPAANTPYGEKWEPRNFSSFRVYLGTDGEDPIMLSHVYVDITYYEHEVFQPQAGFTSVKTPSRGVIQIPYFSSSTTLNFPAVRVAAKGGKYNYSLVDIGDYYASPIRVQTQRGIKALAYRR